jgi:hypothetical protein
MGVMQPQLQQLSQKMAQYAARAWVWLMRLLHLGLIQAQRLAAWMQKINLPKIPLTPFQWVALIYVVLGLAFLVATPIFEASDELWHFGMVEYIAVNQDLPIQQPGMITPYRQEGSQPPLYYALAAALISPFDIGDVEALREPNPHVQAGIPGNVGNKNLVLRESPIPPLQNTALAVYVLRVVGVLMGLVTIWAVYKSGQLISPQRPVVAVVAAAITALNPMFLFISASVNNDNLVTMLNSIIIYYVLLMLRDGFNTRRSLAIAALIAMAALTKLSALVLVPVIAVAALWIARRDKNWQGLVILGSAMAGLWLVLSGWWYLRNLVLYQELFGTAMMAQVAGVRDSFNIGTLFAEFEGFRRFYWGIFGAANIQASELFYALVDFVVFTSMFGTLFLVLQLATIQDFRYARRELTAILFCLGVVLIGMLAFFSWTAQTYATQGRLLFPFLAAISPLLAAGLVEVVWWLLFLLSPPDRSFVQAGEAVAPDILRQGVAWPVRFLGVATLLIPFTIIMPQYVKPPTITALPEDAIPVYARFDDVELIAYSRFDRRYLQGEGVRLTFYWRVMEQSEVDNSLALALVDPLGNAIGKLDTFPGAGTLRTTTWEPGKIYADTYQVNLSPLVNGRYPFGVLVSWWHMPTGETIVPLDSAGNTLQAVILNVGAVVSSNARDNVAGLLQLKPEQTELATFMLPEKEPLIQLTAFQFDRDTSMLRLRWTAKTIMDNDYKVFVHVVREENQPPFGQADTFPELPTRYWRFDERFNTEHQINYGEGLPAGEYMLIVGWYDPAVTPEEDPSYGGRLVRAAIAGSDVTPTTYRLFGFSVDADGVITSAELDQLEIELTRMTDPSAEDTPEATTAEPNSGSMDDFADATQETDEPSMTEAAEDAPVATETLSAAAETDDESTATAEATENE